MLTRTVTSTIRGQERLLARALRGARALLDAATTLGLEAPRRRRRRKRTKVEKAVDAKIKKAKKKTHPLKRVKEEE